MVELVKMMMKLLLIAVEFTVQTDRPSNKLRSLLPESLWGRSAIDAPQGGQNQ